MTTFLAVWLILVVYLVARMLIVPRYLYKRLDEIKQYLDAYIRETYDRSDINLDEKSKISTDKMLELYSEFDSKWFFPRVVFFEISKWRYRQFFKELV